MRRVLELLGHSAAIGAEMAGLQLAFYLAVRNAAPRRDDERLVTSGNARCKALD